MRSEVEVGQFNKIGRIFLEVYPYYMSKNKGPGKPYQRCFIYQRVDSYAIMVYKPKALSFYY
jgi:hypothetical protein